MKKYVHKLYKKNSYSYTITVPKELVDDYGWRDGQKLSIKAGPRKSVVIKDWRAR